MTMDVTAIDHINLRFPADRLEEVIDFYVETLGFETRFDDPYEAVSDDPGLFPVFLGEGGRFYVNPTEEFDPAASNYRHVAVRVAESPESVEKRLADAGVSVDNEASRERDDPEIGSYTSYYVSDPFGYTIEFMAIGD
ncbi:VOC family protein [Halomontanus rarus]|uniref:VOC family protein n=1 Tax=Halomontanus rarus TaxID=3034020 RepID=UPI001A97F002